jgi:hypothetical protein
MDRLFPDNLVSRLNTLQGFLRSNILGQDEVLGEIAALLRRGFCELRFPNRPVASMLLLGPTGVGKTETCNLLTRHLFGSDDKLIRLDMSEYQEQRSIGVLLGAYLGERGLLGHYFDLALGSGLLLLDEIEKAHAKRWFVEHRGPRWTDEARNLSPVSAQMRLQQIGLRCAQTSRAIAFGEITYAYQCSGTPC